MGRFLRYTLCLLLFSLLVSAGGIASSQTLSAWLPFEQETSSRLLKAPHKDQIEAAYSDANRHQVGMTRQIRLPVASQVCLKVIRPITACKVSVNFTDTRSSFTQHYPEELSPPPRTTVAI